MTSTINLASTAQKATSPFLHYIFSKSLDESLGEELLAWCDTCSAWRQQRIEGFYDTENIDLGRSEVPSQLEAFRSTDVLLEIRTQLGVLFRKEFDDRVDIMLQRMTAGQRMGVHSDYGPYGQTHRLIIHLCSSWAPTHGGLLLLLASETPSSRADLDKIYPPRHGNALAFEVSRTSFHAVSPVFSGRRYTLAYSLYAKGGYDD